MEKRYHPALDFVLGMERAWPSLLPALSSLCKKRHIVPRADGYPMSLQSWAKVIGVAVKKDVLPALSPAQLAAWPPKEAILVDHSLGIAAPIALAWNNTRQVYRFDATTHQHLLAMTDTGDLPLSLFNRLPHPVFFVEDQSKIEVSDGLSINVSGFFVRVSKTEDALGENNGESYRRIQILPILDNSSRPAISSVEPWPSSAGAVSLDLDSHLALDHYTQKGTTIEAMVEHSLSKIDRVRSSPNGNRYKAEAKSGVVFSNSSNPMLRAVYEWAATRIPLLVYLASEKPDIVVGQRASPGVPVAQPSTSTPVSKAKTQYNDVGFREGAVFRQRMADIDEIASIRSAAGSGPSPRPHWRRAHWHRHWVGPKHKPEERMLVPRWQAAVPVLGTVSELAAQGPVRHPVK